MVNIILSKEKATEEIEKLKSIERSDRVFMIEDLKAPYNRVCYAAKSQKKAERWIDKQVSPENFIMSEWEPE